ncbi:GNAT family N-acetyltransferase [Lysinibacillus odysseyi]|uniref:GNAT family acetyltransferase n=1 Tax=Lysinibacillus odysseyi 34hs-1 = NBRC 100172 TaxID=1220589 RepID=A0A0A3IGQ4_9BACI|nr:GNAT family N-acetyltransferase [Lysinibacillus odysseyi]KGR82003.1 GNAT family acetyltransferase [Lysinibacillus odysseyi 34hs-1 = NBRC 100172]
MVYLKLVKHDQKYAEEMSRLTSDWRVKDALGLNEKQISLQGTQDYIDFILHEEKQFKQLSRVMLNKEDQLIGVITLKSISPYSKTAHIGTWIAAPYWGKGYNELAKKMILTIAFKEMGLKYVFAGATVDNVRSQKAQIKLPYMLIDVGAQFPDELEKIEAETHSKCILNVITRELFLEYLQSSSL